jgi:inner membrane protein
MAAVVNPEQSLAITAGIAIGSVLPDIDNGSSLIGRYIPVVPKLLKHRGVSHSPWIPLVLVAFTPTRAIGVGIFLHLLMDLFTVEGIPLLWPNHKKFHMPIISRFIRSGGIVDNILGAVLWMAVICLYIRLALGYNIPQI